LSDRKHRDHTDATRPASADGSGEQESLLDFPCTFPIKAMGRTDSALEAVVLEIIRRHAPGFDAESLELRLSSGGKWLSVTARIQATSKEQLDAIYYELTAHELVVYAL
jgi:putative lipoic acid-binding regulatory protein